MTKPLAIELFAGLHGWGEGAVAEGYRVVGFDLFDMCGDLGILRPSGDIQLVLQDVLTIHGRQCKDAALIVASPPCQAYSYRAMPWKRAKALPPPDNSLFEACFRIQREASEAANRYIPLVVENVCGAQKWVGRAKWHFGSFYLWGDVPALMPITRKAVKVPTMGAGGYPPDHPKHVPGLAFNGHADRNLRRRTDVGNGVRFTSRDCGIENTIANALDGCKQKGSGHAWYRGEVGSKSSARKAASAHIAKIPRVLSTWIARTYYTHPVLAGDLPRDGADDNSTETRA